MGGRIGIEDPGIYFSKLKEFRDCLMIKPRLTMFNVRILSDNGDKLILRRPTEASPEIYMSHEPYYHLVRTLDERGYSWYFIYPSDAIVLQRPIYDATINLSDIEGKDIREQDDFIQKKLKNVKPIGTVYPWNIKDHYLSNIDIINLSN